YAAKDRSYSPAARLQMRAYLNARIAEHRSLTRAEVALAFAEAQAFTGNNHTQNDIFDEEDDFHPLPISFWWFTEGAVITRAHPAYKQLIGARIISIGGIPVAQARARVERFIAGTAEHKLYASPSWLRRMEVLKAVGLADGKTAAFSLMDSAGKRFTANLPVSPTRDPAVQSLPWRESVVPGKGDEPWPQATDSLRSLPRYLQKPADLTYERLSGGRILYVRSNDLYNYDDASPISGKAYAMMDDIVGKPSWPRHVIVDLRFNEGGDFFKIILLARSLTELTKPDGRIYVITGRATNSAAIIFTALLKAGAPGRTTIVGEEISDHEAFWSEGGNLKAPVSGLPLRYTDGYHDWANGCTDRDRCYWPAMFYGVAAGSLAPDIPVTHSYAGYVAGRDPDLEAILKDLRTRDSTIGEVTP
ncbi:MAG: hypothetical protein ACXWVJ_04555, partial [Caulobacteraceae bacterium]